MRDVETSDLEAAIERSGRANRILRQCVLAAEYGSSNTIPLVAVREAAGLLRQAAADLDALVGMQEER